MHVEIHVTAGPAKGQQFVFTEPTWFLVGRDADAQISLPDDHYVSRRHFLLKLFPSECLLRDLHSTNGVLVNGIQYGGKRAQHEGEKQVLQEMMTVCLKNGDEIVLGDTRITIFINPLEGKIPHDPLPKTNRKMIVDNEERAEAIPSQTMSWHNEGLEEVERPS